MEIVTITSESTLSFSSENNVQVYELPKPAGVSTLKQFDSPSLPQQRLHFENELPLPMEIWELIFSLLATKQEVAPLRLVSTEFKAHADPISAMLPYAEVDYSSPLMNEKRSFTSPMSKDRQYAITPTSFGFVATVFCLAKCEDVYHVGLKPVEKNDSKHNETQIEFFRPFSEYFQGEQIKYKQALELRKNVFITLGNSGELHVLNLEKRDCNVLQSSGAEIEHLLKLSDSSFAAITSDSSMMIWDLEKGICEKTIEWVGQHYSYIRSFIKLPKENACLISERSGIFRLDLSTEETSEVTREITWCDIETNKRKTLYIENSKFIQLFSDDKVVLCWYQYCIVTSVDNLFSGIELNAQNSQKIEFNINYWHHKFYVLANHHIAYHARHQSTGGCFLEIYDLNKQQVVFHYDLQHEPLYEIIALADHRLLLCTKDEMTILPFATKK